MVTEWQPKEYEAIVASTRPVQIAGTDHLTQFALEALEGMAEQVTADFVPMTVEHLDYLPPVGRWHSAEVVEADDGEHELRLQGSELRQLVPIGDDPDVLALVDDLPLFDRQPLTTDSVFLQIETRNYEPDDIEDLLDSSPIPIRPEEKWSSLPPLILTLSVPVVWGACRFTGAFFETLGKESAESFAKWLRNAWARSKHPDRDRMLKLQFELDDATIYGFIPSASDEDDSGLIAGLRMATLLAEFAGLQQEQAVIQDLKRVAFIFDGGEWELAWWTDGDSVHQTHWFLNNMPDPDQYLGRPMLDRQSLEDPPDAD